MNKIFLAIFKALWQIHLENMVILATLTDKDVNDKEFHEFHENFEKIMKEVNEV